MVKRSSEQHGIVGKGSDSQERWVSSGKVCQDWSVIWSSQGVVGKADGKSAMVGTDGQQC